MRRAALLFFALRAAGQPAPSPALAPGVSFNLSRASVFPFACGASLLAAHGACADACSRTLSVTADASGAYFTLTPFPSTPGCPCQAGGGQIGADGALIASFPFGLWSGGGPRLSVNVSATSCTTWTVREPDEEESIFYWYSAPPLDCSAVYVVTTPGAPCATAQAARLQLALPPVAMNLTLQRTHVGPAYCSLPVLKLSSLLYSCTNVCSLAISLSKPADGGLFALSPRYATVDGCNCTGSATALLPPAGQPFSVSLRNGITAVLKTYTWSTSSDIAPSAFVYSYNETLGSMHLSFEAVGCTTFRASAAPSGRWTTSVFACTATYEVDAESMPPGVSCLLSPHPAVVGGGPRGGGGGGKKGVLAVSILALVLAVGAMGLAGFLLVVSRRRVSGGGGGAWGERLLGETELTGDYDKMAPAEA